MARTPKRPRDANQLAKSIVDVAVGDKENTDLTAVQDTRDSKERMRQGGKKGGKLRAENLSAEQRSKIAQHASNTRWKNVKP